MVNFAFTTTAGNIGGSSNFDVSIWPSDPYIGEAVRVVITGDGGHSVPNDLKDIWVQTDVGESGAAYDYMPGKNAEIARGRFFPHAYSTAGSKTLTISSWTFGSAVLSQTETFTVIDPDAQTWDKTFYVDFNGSTSGMPAASSSVVRILSFSDWEAAENSTSSTDRIRVRFRGNDTVHSATTVNNWGQNAARIYVDTFGGGRATIRDATGTYGGYNFIVPRVSDQRVIIRDIDFEGSYNPITGQLDDSLFVGFSTSGQERTACSMWRCTAKGMDKLMVGSGSQENDRRYKLAYVDCHVTDWFDYGLGFSGPCDTWMARGCYVVQNPLAGVGDAKTNVNPEYPDHGPLRVSRFNYGSITDSELRSVNGWSPLSPTYGIQPAIRIYMNANDPNTQFTVIGNDTSGRICVQWGHASQSEDIFTPAECLVACNSHDFGRQGAQFLQSHTGGLFAHSNVAYNPNISSARSSQVLTLLDVNNFFANSSTNSASYEKESYLGFNLYFSDATSSLHHGADEIDETIEDTQAGLVPNVTKEHNLISGDGHTGSYTAAAAFSRGDNFRAITSGAADSTATDGPPVDFNFNQRSNPTNIGAHHTAGADVSVTSPSNSVAPTIAANPVQSGHYVVTEIGTWSDTQHHMLEFNWKLDGSESPSAALTHAATYTGSDSGNLTCELVRTNRSGTRASATSNTL